MTAISVSPDRLLRQTTPPAALITLTSATSRIFVATIAPSFAATFGRRGPLTSRPRGGRRAVSLTVGTMISNIRFQNGFRIERFHQIADPPRYVVANFAHLLDREIFGVL